MRLLLLLLLLNVFKGPVLYGLALGLESAPSDLVEKGRGIHAQLQESAKEEGFLQRLFGTNCYGQAIRRLNTDCRHMTDEQRQRLSFDLARCFLSQSTTASETLPRPCPTQGSITKCVEGLNEKAFSVYTQFFINVHSVCLFVANQDYAHQAEELTRIMYMASTATLAAIQQINVDITNQAQVLHTLNAGLSDIGGSLRHLDVDLHQGLGQLSELNLQAAHVGAALNTSINLQEVLATRQNVTAQVLGDLSTQEERRAAAAQSHWQAADQAAAALEARQRRYESLQSSLVSASEALAGRAVSLQTSLEALGHAQERSHELLSYIKGSSHTTSDLLGYTASAVTLWLVCALLPVNGQGSYRALGLLLVAVTFMAERCLLSSLPTWGWHMTPEGLIPVTVFLPVPLPWLLNSLGPHPVALVNPRWAVRGSALILGLLLLIQWSRLAFKSRHDHNEFKALIQSLEHQLSVVNRQQQAILQHLGIHLGPTQSPSQLTAMQLNAVKQQWQAACSRPDDAILPAIGSSTAPPVGDHDLTYTPSRPLLTTPHQVSVVKHGTILRTEATCVQLAAHEDAPVPATPMVGSVGTDQLVDNSQHKSYGDGVDAVHGDPGQAIPIDVTRHKRKRVSATSSAHDDQDAEPVDTHRSCRPGKAMRT